MAKPVCSRCKVELHGNAETMPHLCADIRKRRDRQEKLVGIVEDILISYGVYSALADRPGTDSTDLSGDIVKALSGMLDG